MAIAAPAVPSGPAHVAVVSFLAARAAPTGGFWIALAGGVALARVAERRGARLGFGASAAAMLETVAIIGPARFGIPFTQAATAPMLGRLEARGWRPLPQILACAAIRLLHNAATTAFFIWVVTGGLDAYAGTYDAIGRRFGLEVGSADALVLTLVGLVAWAAFASTIQVLIYRRGLESWDRLAAHAPHIWVDMQPKNATGERGAVAEGSAAAPKERRFDPRAITLAAAVAFALLLASTNWALLGAVAAWLTLAWLLAKPDKEAIPPGLLFAALLAGTALLFSLGGGLGLDVALRRASRAALLVLTATWLRGAAGAEGLREVSRRGLGKLRRVPSAPEAALVLDQIASEGRLAAAARTFEQRLRGVPKRPLPLVDAVLHWVVTEAGEVRARPAKRPLTLKLRPADAALFVAAVLPALTLGL
jgi:hypothetical protein